ncbi:hypothetical protein [Arsukibacterium sp.]|uniref:hypothetical protein n=1 Tax=Arsukibacterium sp. TaxID=1977258 RepID=UPI002FD9C32E
MRKQPELFLADGTITAKPQRQLLGVMQDIEAAWLRLAKFELKKQQLYSHFAQQALQYEHKLCQQSAQLISDLLQYANDDRLSVQWRVMLMDWTDELLQQLECHSLVAPDVNIKALREQFYQCYDDHWVSWEDIDEDESEYSDLDMDLFAEADDEPLLDFYATEEQLQSAMAEKLIALLPELANIGAQSSAERVKSMLLSCYQTLRLAQLPAEILQPMISLLAEYRQRLDWLCSPMAQAASAEGWVWNTFGKLTKAELSKALDRHVKQLKQELAEVKSLMQYSQSFQQLTPLLIKRHQQHGDYGWGGVGRQLPGHYH